MHNQSASNANMRILWLAWKDREHPLAGGAEVVSNELAKRLARDGHEVKFVVGGFPGGASEETRDGYAVARVGGRFSVYWKAYRYYKKHLGEWPDIVIDEMNTIPFFARFYARQRVILLVHQLCREIWFYQMPLPLAIAGYLLEPVYLRLLSGSEVITVSESTKRDLMRYGFKPENIHIISEGIEIEPTASPLAVQKYERPTVLALGALRAMKRTKHIVRSFEILKKNLPEAQLMVAGQSEDRYGEEVVEMMRRSSYASDIHYFGHVSKERKKELMQKSNVICVTSVKEGWGLVVTEAASQGTPAVVYDADGLRDSVRNDETGLITRENAPAALAQALTRLLADKPLYDKLARAAWNWSQEITFDKGCEQFRNTLAAYA